MKRMVEIPCSYGDYNNGPIVARVVDVRYQMPPDLFTMPRPRWYLLIVWEQVAQPALIVTAYTSGQQTNDDDGKEMCTKLATQLAGYMPGVMAIELCERVEGVPHTRGRWEKRQTMQAVPT